MKKFGNEQMSKLMFKLPESSSSLICVICEICGKLPQSGFIIPNDLTICGEKKKSPPDLHLKATQNNEIHQFFNLHQSPSLCLRTLFQ
jgi:hypothetical protein